MISNPPANPPSAGDRERQKGGERQEGGEKRPRILLKSVRRKGKNRTFTKVLTKTETV